MAQGDKQQFRLFLFVLAGCLFFSLVAAYFLKRLPTEDLSWSAPGSAVHAVLKRRAPFAAGKFYPADAAALRQQVVTLLARAGGPSFGARPRLVLSPHAGYEYSGAIAAGAFRPLIGSGYTRAVIIGRSHTSLFSGIAADDHDAWSTPLGDAAVDSAYIKGLIDKTDAVRIDAAPHDGEHSLEVLLPFLQVALGPDLKIVPLLFGSDDPGAAGELAAALAENSDDETVVIVSSDLSHYPDYDTARTLDGATVASILAGNAGDFWASLRSREQAALGAGEAETLACAGVAILSGLDLAEKMGWTPRLVGYANSGDALPSARERVVGYAAVGFYGKTAGGEPAALTAAERESAVKIVRETLAAAFDRKEYAPAAGSAGLERQLGVFVTLKKRGELRGCIGVFDPDRPLRESIREMSLAAAFEDPRFQPLERSELDDLEIEVSVLSPLTRVFDPGLIVAGEHGVELDSGGRSGVFLPQVATEQGWDRETFLTELCTEKAGLPGDCWQDPGTALRVFTADVFGGRFRP